MNLIKPDYNNSVVNVTNQILGLENKIKELKNLKKKILYMIIDGMGYNLLLNNTNLIPIKKITSVFPSTTACAINSIMSGKEPIEHAITGWYVFLKEIGGIIAPLPFYLRYGHSKIPLEYKKKLFPKKAFKNVVTDKKIKLKDNEKYAYETFNGFFSQSLKTINKHNLVYSYYPGLDSTEHKFGPNSKQTKEHLKLIEKKIGQLIKKMPKNSSLIITADHGQINNSKKDLITLTERIKDMLVLPLTGEPRVAYCYVKSDKTKDFEFEIKKQYQDKILLKKSSDLIKEGFFGFKKENKSLQDRIGNYTLILKKNYIIKDHLFNEKLKFKKGNHGGVSPDEMFVPLLRFDK